MKNMLYRRQKDGVEVISLFHVPDRAPSKPKNHNFVWIAVRYVKSGHKGYILKSDLSDPALYTPMGELDPSSIWENGPHGSGRASQYPSVAAAEEDMREREIRKRCKKILETVFPGVDPGPGGKAALDQAVHLLMVGI